jgi:hypothetical protein
MKKVTGRNNLSKESIYWLALVKPFATAALGEIRCGVSVPRKDPLGSQKSFDTHGPLAWILAVLIPTSAPKPKRNPSANLELALWKTQALSTLRWKVLAVSAETD